MLFAFFGYMCYVLLPKFEYSKIDAKFARCIFWGYSYTQKIYRFHDLDAKRVRISRNVLFFEDSFSFCLTAESTDSIVHSTPLLFYFNDKPDPNVGVPLDAYRPSPSLNSGIPSSSHILPSFVPLNSVFTAQFGRVSKLLFRLSFLSSLDHN